MGTQIALAIDSGKIPGILTHVYDDSKEASSALVSKLNTKPEIVENSQLIIDTRNATKNIDSEKIVKL